jgi:hypothetical protein
MELNTPLSGSNNTAMKTILKLEELAMALGCLYFLYIFGFQWWWYLLFLLGPDISFLGYLGGNKIGAIVYNIFHHKAIALAFVAIGLFMGDIADVSIAMVLLGIGLVMFGHSSMDRFFGYGLKTFEGFKYTHLGQIGKK